MKLRFFLFLSCFVFLSGCQHMDLKKGEGQKVPIAKLNPEVLNHFYPLIQKELKDDLFFQRDQRTERKTLEYGYSFFKMMKGDYTYTPPPPFLIDLGKEVCKALNIPPQEFSNFIISLYEPGFHLEPHADVDHSGFKEYGFYFSEKVYGVIIESDPKGHFYIIYYDGEGLPPLDLKPIFSLKEEPGTIFVLQGKYRHAPFFHGVTEISKRRISITFRNVLFKP